ncbi:hypothetical protein [Thalassotalea ganghwensis]
MKNMNDELRKLYESKWQALIDGVSQLKSQAASPLLIKVKDSYMHADLRVMIVGQETDKWFGCFNETQLGIQELMDGYFKYFYQVSKNGKERGKRAFWNDKNFSFFEKYINVQNKDIEFVWNNISKIGANGRGKPPKDIWDLEKSSFDVIKGEIEILKPDLILFTTGKRDSYIKFHCGNNTQFLPKLYFEGSTLAKQTHNLIAEVQMEYFPDICAIRVEHPNRRTLANSVIIEIIKQCWDEKLS